MADPSDLFHHPHHFSLFSDSGSGSGSEPDSEDPDFLALGFGGLGLGLGLGLGFPNQEDDWTAAAAAAEDFFVGLRRGLVEIPGSDTDDEEQIVAIGPDPDPVPDLCWDCLRIDDEFEWEEVDAPRAAAASDTAGGVAAFENPIEIQESDDELEEELAAVSNWEFLLTMHAFGNPPEEESSYFVEDHDHGGELAYTSEYDEVLFDQFQEQEGAAKGGPPAARSVVEALPTVALKAEEVAAVAAVAAEKGSPANCAVCKDEFSAEERVKKLPCCHYYHEECILPWLGMRNTCPLCRYELPTDDVEYENRKARRGSVAAEEEEVRVRYDFEMLPEALDA